MKRKRGIITSGIPALTPTLITDKNTGEVISWEDYRANDLSNLLDWVRAETQYLFDLDPAKALRVAGELRGSANSHARSNGYKARHMDLARDIKAKSRLAELVYHKLVSETAGFVMNPNRNKKPHVFSRTVNLGAVDSQMCVLEREDHELILSWKCWSREYELRFTLPRYVQARNITRFSLPTVSDKGFVFTHEEIPEPITGERVSGVDLGRVQPFTMVVLSARGKVLAEHRTSPQLRATNAKRERILEEVRDTRLKAERREALGLDATPQREQVRLLRNKAARLSPTINAQIGSQIATHVTRHKVNLLRVESLPWATGAKYGSKWSHGQARSSITHATNRRGGHTEEVDPRGTSQHCHACKTKIVHKTKSRTVWCVDCKTTLDRDYNAAMNIAKKQSYPVLFNRLDGSTCSESSLDESQGIGQSPNSPSFKTLQTLEI